MSEQDGAQSSTKQRRSRKTNTANQQNGKQTPAVQRPTNDDQDAWKAYWGAQGQPWRTEPEIDTDRQKYLAERRSIAPNINQGIYPFKDIKLNRADVEWLLATHVETTWQTGTNLTIRTGLDLRGANLRGIDLHRLPLTGLLAGLDSEVWFKATKEQREAAAIHLEGTNLSLCDLTQAQFKSAHLEGANLSNAHFEWSSLRGAYLGGKTIPEACIGQNPVSKDHIPKLPGANLQYTFFNAATTLEETDLGNEQDGYIRLIDVRWGGVNLAAVNWSQIHMLGSEQEACQGKTSAGVKKDKIARLKEYDEAVRANRQLAIALQEQGLSEDAAHFAYHAQLMQRRVFWYQGKILQYLFSLLLDLLTGYGYKPLRSFFGYLIVITIFAVTYYLLSSHLAWNEALVISMTAFHGRGFFPEQFHPGDPQALVAAIEAFVGLLIEVTFIATLTQRLFRK